MGRGSAVASIAASCIAFSCGPAKTTPGEFGVAELMYVDAYRYCEADCALDTPLAATATAWVDIVGYEDLPYATLRAASAEIVSVQPTASGEHYRVVGVAPGVTTLELRDRDEGVLDRFPFEVRAIAALRGLPAETTPLRTGRRGFSFALTYEGALGEPLRGAGAALEMEVSGSATAEISTDLGTAAERVATFSLGSVSRMYDDLGIGSDQSGEPGEAVVLLPAGRRYRFAVDSAVPVVATIALSARVEDQTATVEAELEMANPEDRVSACCEWRVEPVDAARVGPVECQSAVFTSNTPEVERNVTAVCASHGVEGSISVHLLTYPDP